MEENLASMLSDDLNIFFNLQKCLYTLNESTVFSNLIIQIRILFRSIIGLYCKNLSIYFTLLGCRYYLEMKMETQPRKSAFPHLCVKNWSVCALLFSFLNVSKVFLHASLTSLLARDCIITWPVSTCISLRNWWPFRVVKIMCFWKPHKYLWSWRSSW